ncbi:hypothetical protein [Clostridium perfringens]|uniref:hypothetical protein n=1 Tax=Clostridium perfringens TaxID=1502 RepID=UPI0024BD2C5D|nr:hypothetical protein [Clostridium perfringens]ELC8466043.1 hypothetical protein [Clostridium perfringens]
MKINKTLIKLYHYGNEEKIKKYCDDLYREINTELYVYEYIEYSMKLCTYIILETLKNKKTESSNALIIARNFLVGSLERVKFGELDLKIENDFFYKFNKRSINVRIKIIMEAIEILWCLYKMDINNIVECFHKNFKKIGNINTYRIEHSDSLLEVIYDDFMSIEDCGKEIECIIYE